MEEVSTGVRLHGARRPASLLRLASDDRLVAFVRAGDERAFEVLYDRHHRPILGFCRHMLGTREEAEDAVQQTFLSAYRDLLASTKPIQSRPWLFAIARNRCLSMLRARRAHTTLEVAEPSTEGLAATVERREDVRELLADLARLPERQRAALLLAELGALDHAGIATVLGCRKEQVKALVFQARSSLAADRQARATPCEDVRELLATASGATLRRAALRRHLAACTGCRAFKAEVAHQRQLLAVALPVVPTAMLKAGALSFGATGTTASGAAGASGAASGLAAAGATGAGAGSGVVGAGLLTTGVTKIALVVTLAGAVAGGGALTVDAVREDGHPGVHRGGTPHTVPSSVPPLAPLSSNRAGTPTPDEAAIGTARGRDLVRPPSSRARGFTPTLRPGAGGNGAAARSFARSRRAAHGNASAHPTGAARGRGAPSRIRPAKPPPGPGGGASRPHSKDGAAIAPQGEANAVHGTDPGRGARADDALPGEVPGIERRQERAPATPAKGAQSDG